MRPATRISWRMMPVRFPERTCTSLTNQAGVGPGSQRMRPHQFVSRLRCCNAEERCWRHHHVTGRGANRLGSTPTTLRARPETPRLTQLAERSAVTVSRTGSGCWRSVPVPSTPSALLRLCRHAPGPGLATPRVGMHLSPACLTDFPASVEEVANVAVFAASCRRQT
jgi:hypothetical protein